MALWALLLIVLGISCIYAACPDSQLIHPCNCRIISDRFGEDFAIVSCANIYSEDVLMNALSFTKGKKLFEFQLINSNLNFIPDDAFLDTTYEVLSFENSSISALSDTNVAFRGLENSLRLLEIVNCSFLTNWDWTQLSHLNHLMEILVTESDLTNIVNGINTIRHLELEALVFKRNNIEWLDSHIFAPFELLSRVTLDFNRIQHIERTMFPKPAMHLKILGLSYNRITDLPQDIFIQMPSLNSLYLTGNPLLVIDEATFKPIWYQLKLFFFHDTKLSCDCRLTWITKMDNSQKFIHSFCNSPPHTKGRDIQSMQPHELWC